MLGIRAFLSTSVDYLPSHLPLQNPLLRGLRCLNAQKRTIESSVNAVQTLARKLKPELDVSQVSDEWKVYSYDPNVTQKETEELITLREHAVFCLQYSDESLS